MHRLPGWVVSLIMMAATAAAAQDALPSRSIVAGVAAVDASVTSADLLRQMAEWTRDYSSWKAWQARWRNTPEPGLFSAKPRRQPPIPPDWLRSACATAAHDDELLAGACDAWREWARNDPFADAFSQQLAQRRRSHEAQDRTQWWERLHVDGYWPMTQSGTDTVGVVGMHATMQVLKRFHVFMAPGIILMRVPALDGSHTWSAATDWGFSYRLFDFRMPLWDRGTSAHFNMAKVWIVGNNASMASLGGDMYVAGLSLTFKKR